MTAPSDTAIQAPSSLKQRKFSFTFWVVFLSMTLFGLFLIFSPERKIVERYRVIDLETSQILSAIHTYKSQFGELPKGGNRAVFRALRGENPRHVVFFECPATRISPDGDLLDPWGTPFKLYFSGEETLIRSAGPNRQFEDSADKHFDDYIR